MILENMKVSWAKLREDNKEENYNKDGFEWTIQVAVTDDFADKWDKGGMKPASRADKETGEKYIKFKRATTWKKSGDAKKLPIVVDKFGEPFSANIGNNSTCNIQYSKFPYGEGNFSTDLIAVQVVDLVEFNGEGGDEGAAFTYEAKAVVPLTEVDLADAEDDIPF
jgi:hypothetical protein